MSNVTINNINGGYMIASNGAKIDSKFHITIKPEKGTKLKPAKKEEKADTLPANVGVSFAGPNESAEPRKSFKDFLKG